MYIAIGETSSSFISHRDKFFGSAALVPQATPADVPPARTTPRRSRKG